MCVYVRGNRVKLPLQRCHVYASAHVGIFPRLNASDFLFLFLFFLRARTLLYQLCGSFLFSFFFEFVFLLLENCDDDG